MVLAYQVRLGRVAKPLKCPICKKSKPVEGHHEDYSKPLKVKWCCRQCHADIHAQ